MCMQVPVVVCHAYEANHLAASKGCLRGARLCRLHVATERAGLSRCLVLLRRECSLLLATQ